MEELSNEEFQGWSDYFARQPPEWRDDLRTYYIMSSIGGGKTSAEEIFPSLAQLKEAEAAVDKEERELKEQAKMRRTLKASPFAVKFAKHGIS